VRAGSEWSAALVVDQSTDRATADALAPLLADPRVHYVQSTERGKGAALNTGLAMARTEIVACTDDDCIVAADWLDSMAAAFAGRPQVAIVFGAVAPVPHDITRFVWRFARTAHSPTCR